MKIGNNKIFRKSVEQHKTKTLVVIDIIDEELKSFMITNLYNNEKIILSIDNISRMYKVKRVITSNTSDRFTVYLKCKHKWNEL